ncbi:hypothetical protein ACFL3I_09400 [Pseudomonadota bacterium]
MLIRGFISLAAVSLLFAGSAFAGKKDNAGNMCKDKDVVGSYMQSAEYDFTDGYGNLVDRFYVDQLNLSSGGTVHERLTAGQDLIMYAGLGSTWLGSWTCRNDGKLLVTALSADYAPIPTNTLFPGSLSDIALVYHYRWTYLFSVEDKDTLKLEKYAVRGYGMTEDPTDPDAGGIIIEGDEEIYLDRLIPSDADLLP